MSDVLQQETLAQRLDTEMIGWLTTVTGDGQPQSSPIWFAWDGEAFWLRSQATAGKVRNIGINPRVSLHLSDDGKGGEIVTIDALAEVEELPAGVEEAYLAKYGDSIRDDLHTTPEAIAVDYPTTIRITPTRSRAW